MVDNGTSEENILWQVYKIQISDMLHQSHECSGLIGVGNVVNQVLTNPLVV